MQANLSIRDPSPRFSGTSFRLEQAEESFKARVLEHPFLTKCADGSISMQQLNNFLAQHGKYSSYFTRYLCALMSQLEDGNDVLQLASNLAEELGCTTKDTVPHSRIYADLLEHFEIRATEHKPYPQTQNLIDTMFMLCRQPGGFAGLGALALGAEALVPALYARIVDGFRNHGVPDSSLQFFLIHMECDDGHADTMYSIIRKAVRETPRLDLVVMSAGEIAINARLKFFDALLENRS